ncbi:MAG TPA: SDR family NAD(P)-dependent oxidoreductase [Pseudomonadales bacterium]
MKRQWAGRRVWLVGASAGIGAELAMVLAQAGAQVFISARRGDALALVAHGYSNITPILCDVSDVAHCERAATEIGRRVGYVDTVIFNAGQCEYIDVQAFDPALVRAITEVNFLGAVNIVAAALPLIRKAPRASLPCILGVSSLATRLPFTRAQAYGASKAALDYFLDTLAVDLAEEGIRVIPVAPGFVETRLTAGNAFPMPMQISARVAAEAISEAFCRGHNRIAFPKGMAWGLNVLSILPARWRIAIARKLAGNVHTETDQVAS